ncbi:hypothetical protein BJ165DRAFT_1535756 [Panaeolus papilionaceus]|nr:hypothetical protein BJ165DRAFT_1535756 [Panaeolus papilionaceus]
MHPQMLPRPYVLMTTSTFPLAHRHLQPPHAQLPTVHLSSSDPSSSNTSPLVVPMSALAVAAFKSGMIALGVLRLLKVQVQDVATMCNAVARGGDVIYTTVNKFARWANEVTHASRDMDRERRVYSRFFPNVVVILFPCHRRYFPHPSSTATSIPISSHIPSFFHGLFPSRPPILDFTFVHAHIFPLSRSIPGDPTLKPYHNHRHLISASHVCSPLVS